MREITSHKVNGLNEALKIEATDEPGAGGANHEYAILLPPEAAPRDCEHDGNGFHIAFQNGPIAEAGVNGVSNEALLAIVEDRLACFERGPYACNENQMALKSVRNAMDWLHFRTRNRTDRGVEGTLTK